jgi:hypothetical protein
MDLSNNYFRGEIKDDFIASMVIEDLNLENNLFWGAIPSSLSTVSSLTSLRLNLNRFDGNVPESLCDLRMFDEAGLREGLVVLEADCLPRRGITDNNCSCCTECCDRIAMSCLANDNPQVAVTQIDPICLASLPWDRLNGILPSV